MLFRLVLYVVDVSSPFLLFRLLITLSSGLAGFLDPPTEFLSTLGRGIKYQCYKHDLFFLNFFPYNTGSTIFAQIDPLT
jgi:hypothetical protein